MLSHEKLDVYRVAVQFAALARRVVAGFPRGSADIADQLMRAARSSIPNIAEGAGKNTRAHRVRYLDDARGSAMECGACLDIAKLEEIVAEAQSVEGKTLLEREVAMLTNLIR